MALRTYCIYIETPVGTPLGDSIHDIRHWLDRHKIAPVELKLESTDGTLSLDIWFRSQDEVSSVAPIPDTAANSRLMSRSLFFGLRWYAAFTMPESIRRA